MTWDAPRQICDGCEVDGKPLEKRWGFQLPGPPGGIVASNGRILQCCDHVLKGTDVCTMGSDACNKGNHVLFSDDSELPRYRWHLRCILLKMPAISLLTGGRTWNVSGLAAEGSPIWGDECSVAQLPGTDILVMNSRVDSNNNSLTMPGYGRATSFSSDWGLTWGPAARRDTLPDGICGGDMISTTGSALGNGLLTSNVNGGCKGLGCHEFPAPATNWTGTRANLTLSFSSDGIAWRRLVHIWPGNATYSSLTDLGSGLVGCLYDQGEHER